MALGAGISTASIYAGTGALLAIASIPRGRQAMRAALVVTGMAGLAWAVALHRGIFVATGFGALVVINLLTLAIALPRRGAISFLPEEEALATRSFATLSRQSFRALLDQGLWIHGQPGEALLEEGRPVSHLFWLSEGDVTIASGGREIARSGPGHFFGELDVFSSSPAIATIRLATPALFWCVATEALKTFLAENPEFRPAIEMALAVELREKLRARNAQLVAAQG